MIFLWKYRHSSKAVKGRPNFSAYKIYSTAPSSAFKRWPFLVRAFQPKQEQMSTIAAIIGTWQ
ncbi:hypothetical protein Scep_028078 [Stephania cephalantha]|uniref:Uncharacterized protein n=1 Tax=Stephania cephalantha TaxID=152367 RepID=A0AAP0HLR0_9MAGN